MWKTSPQKKTFLNVSISQPEFQSQSEGVPPYPSTTVPLLASAAEARQPLAWDIFPPVFVSAHRRKKKLSPKENSEGFWVLLRRWDEALAQLSPQADTLEVRCLLMLFQ